MGDWSVGGGEVHVLGDWWAVGVIVCERSELYSGILVVFVGAVVVVDGSV